MQLFDSELKVMEILWKEGDIPAAQIAKELKKSIGWNPNTTYTVIKKCIAKGAITRYEPHFVCHAMITKKQAQVSKLRLLIDTVFGGSKTDFFAAFLQSEELSDEELQKIREMVKEFQ